MRANEIKIQGGKAKFERRINDTFIPMEMELEVGQGVRHVLEHVTGMEVTGMVDTGDNGSQIIHLSANGRRFKVPAYFSTNGFIRVTLHNMQEMN